MQNDLLIVEDLLLLLLDDETGTPAAAGTLPYILGGAVLAELALLDRVETGDPSALNGPEIIAVGDGPLPDPVLQAAYDRIAGKTQRVQPLLLAIGGDLWKTLTDRLIERGLIRREKKRVLGLFPMTRLPAADTRHEAALREEIRAVLVEDKTPDPRTAAVTALLSASGALPALRPTLAWSAKVYKRAKEIEHGNWGAEAVNAAVVRTAAAIAVSTAVVAVTATTTAT